MAETATMTMTMVAQGDGVVTVREGAVPVLDWGCCGDLLWSFVPNFLRAGCPGVQVVFRSLSEPDAEMRASSLLNFLKVLELSGETFVAHVQSKSPYILFITRQAVGRGRSR